MKKVLIINNVETELQQAKEMFEKDMTVNCLTNFQGALAVLKKEQDAYGMILMYVNQGSNDAVMLMQELKAMQLEEKLPLIVVSKDNSQELELLHLRLGVFDYYRSYVDTTYIKNRVLQIMKLISSKNEMAETLDRQTATLRRQYSMLQASAEKLKKNNDKIIDVLASFVEYRNLENSAHIRRIKEFTRVLGEQVMDAYPEYGLTKEKVSIIAAASPLHDIGKIAIPDSILLKPAKLTAEEYDYMKSHTTRGCAFLNNILGIWDESYRRVSYDICRYHHEKYDGSGYPEGLRGEDIPISAQIVSLADVYDALVSETVYKEAYSKEEAYRMIIMGECGMFSPKILESFRLVRDQFEALVDETFEQEE